MTDVICIDHDLAKPCVIWSEKYNLSNRNRATWSQNKLEIKGQEGLTSAGCCTEYQCRLTQRFLELFCFSNTKPFAGGQPLVALSFLHHRWDTWRYFHATVTTFPGFSKGSSFLTLSERIRCHLVRLPRVADLGRTSFAALEAKWKSLWAYDTLGTLSQQRPSWKVPEVHLIFNIVNLGPRSWNDLKQFLLAGSSGICFPILYCGVSQCMETPAETHNTQPWRGQCIWFPFQILARSVLPHGSLYSCRRHREVHDGAYIWFTLEAVTTKYGCHWCLHTNRPTISLILGNSVFGGHTFQTTWEPIEMSHLSMPLYAM